MRYGVFSTPVDGRWTVPTDSGPVPTPSLPPHLGVSERSRSTRPLSVVLRVVPAAAADGRLAGRAEVVDTGESVPIRNVEDLLALLQRLALDANPDATPRVATAADLQD